MGFWLLGVPLPFVRPGHPHPSPLPPSGRGEMVLRERGKRLWRFVWGECLWRFV